MTDDKEPRVMIVDEAWEGLAEAIADNQANGEVMSWRQHMKFSLMRILHPFGVHYLVPAYGRQPGVDRWVLVGSTCWFCK